MAYDAFAEVGENYSAAPECPFWQLDLENEEELLKWLKAEYESLKGDAKPRIANQRKNLAVYRGIQYQTQDTRHRETEAHASGRSKNPRIVYNHMLDMVEQDVSRMTKYRGAVAARTPTEDYQDRIVAGVAEDLIEKFWDKIKIDALMQKAHRAKRILGEDYIFPLWNPHLGPLHPDWLAEVFKKNKIEKDPRELTAGEIRHILRTEVKEIPRLPLIGEDGEQLKGADGKPLWIDRPLRVGDIEYKRFLAWNVFVQARTSYEDAEYVFIEEYVQTQDLIADHPSKARALQETPDHPWFDLEKLEDTSKKGWTVKVHFFHKGTSRLDQGRYVSFVSNAILTNKPNPYQGPDGAIIPGERLCDIEAPGVLHADATVTHGRAPQAVFNNVISMRVRHQYLLAHPKWFAPAKSTTAESLGNDSTIVWYKGPIKPELGVASPTSPQTKELGDDAKENMQQIMGVYGVSRGEPPSGVTAAVALTFLDEQESERANIGVQNHTECLRQLALKTAWIMSDYYQDTDGRLEALLGRKRAGQVKQFKMADLRRIEDLQIQNASALPQQKSARTQYILDLKEKAPGLMPDELMVDLLELGDVKRFQSIVTRSIKAAEAENDELIRTGKTSAPEKYEYHLAHYRSHLGETQEPSYKSLPKSHKEGFEGHLAAHEMIMIEIMAKNPPFAAAVMQEFPAFPIFFTPEPTIDAEASAVPVDPAGLAGAVGGSAPVVPPPAGMAPMAPPLDPIEQGIPPGAEAEALPPDALAPGLETMSPGVPE